METEKKPLSDEEQTLKEELAQTRALQTRRVQRRKADRRRRALRAALLVLALSVLIAAVALALRVFVIDRFFLEDVPETPTVEAAPSEPEASAAPAADPTPTELPEEPGTSEIPESTEIPDEQPPEEEPAEEEPQEEELTEEEPPEEEPAEEGSEDEPSDEFPAPACTYAEKNGETHELDKELYSENAILIDLQTNTVLAEKASDAKIYPASMTKVMTALVACEKITDWDATFTMTQDIIDPLFLADATMAGFVHGEEVSMTDLVYGAILPSGAEATEALARTIAGSEQAYAELMNEKAAELGLTGTHFADASGLHNEDHYTTVHDMAIILEAAMQNERCREVLESAYYVSAKTPQNPDGVAMYNKFLQRLVYASTQDAQIMGAKTGYTSQAMNCCASFGRTPDGRAVVCVTAHAWTGDFCMEDHITLYTGY